MGLNKTRGNMYDGKHITHTWNPIHGTCVCHACKYCYMERYQNPGSPQKIRPLKLDTMEFYTHLGANNTIFIGSSIDIWADNIPSDWLIKILDHCSRFTENHYLFQSKNPRRFLDFSNHHVCKQSSFATTIETNRRFDAMGLAPMVQERAEAMRQLHEQGLTTVVTIEPIMQFDLPEMTELVLKCEPDIVHVGANTHPNIKVPEPYKDDVIQLIEILKNHTKVDVKNNLHRLIR